MNWVGLYPYFKYIQRTKGNQFEELQCKNNVSPNGELSIKRQKLLFEKEVLNAILGLESTITEMEKFLEGPSRLEQTEKRISGCEGKSMEVTHSELGKHKETSKASEACGQLGASQNSQMTGGRGKGHKE